MYRFSIVLILLVLLAACGSPVQDMPTPGAQLSESPTAAPSDTPVSPTGMAALTPTTPAAALHAAIIYQLDTDGSVQMLDATTGTNLALADPTQPEQRLPWSAAPNGQTLALVTGRWDAKSGLIERASLWTVTVNGTNPRKLLDLVAAPVDQRFADTQIVLTGERFQTLAWTPDGAAIVVASAHEGQVDLYAVAADGSAVRRLTQTPDVEFQPSISPDGGLVSYGSAASFGTGAGWGNPGAWVQPLNGGERSGIIGSEPGAAVAATEIVGWIGNRVAALSYDQVRNAATLWAAELHAEPRLLSQSAGAIHWTLGQHAVAWIASRQDGQRVQSHLWSWSGGELAPTQLSPIDEATLIAMSPSGAGIALCTGSIQQSLKLWDGELRDIGTGSCDRLVWSTAGQIAAGGVTLDAPARVVDSASGQAEQLPRGARPIGWNGTTFFFFAPLPNDGGWQLYGRSAGNDTPLGPPVAGLPTNPRLITSDTELPQPAQPTSTPTPSTVPEPMMPPAPPTLEPTPAPGGGLEELRRQLAGLTDGWAGEHAVSVTDLQTAETISVNGSRPQLAACTVKIVLMMAVAQDIEAGRYTEADVAALVRSAMGPSNTAPARELLQIVGGGEIGAGVRRVNEIMWSMGATKSILTHPPGYYWEEYGYADSHGTSENRLTTDDLNLILSKLYRGEALSPWATDYVLNSMTIAPDWMDYALGSPLPAGTRLYHKIGQLYEPENAWNDAAIVVFERGGKPYAYAISYLGSYGASWQDSYAHATSLSAATWRYFSATYQ